MRDEVSWEIALESCDFVFASVEEVKNWLNRDYSTSSFVEYATWLPQILQHETSRGKVTAVFGNRVEIVTNLACAMQRLKTQMLTVCLRQRAKAASNFLKRLLSFDETV